MKKIRVWAETDMIGSEVSTIIEVEDDASPDEIEREAEEAAAELYCWGWDEA